MNRIVIIGNGFDLAHNLKTSYRDFIFWYFNNVMMNLFVNHKIDDSDKLLSFKPSGQFENTILRNSKEIIETAYNNNYNDYGNNPLTMLKELEATGHYKATSSELLERITNNLESKGWTDIESDYYELLKENKSDTETCKHLNEQLDYLKNSLCKYLNGQKAMNSNDRILNAITNSVMHHEIAESSRMLIQEHIPDAISKEEFTIENVTLLNFNYTNTADRYTGFFNSRTKVEVNHIHGTLENLNNIIFGYGDEMDNHFQELVDLNENELLKNSKSIKYLETDSYKKLLRFMEEGVFQVLLMGHSCGNSDRTLLNTIFEHKNCISIKPFCYIDEKGEDNYSELTRNIYRNFKDKTLFRDRVVDKSLCYTLDGHKLYKHNE